MVAYADLCDLNNVGYFVLCAVGSGFEAQHSKLGRARNHVSSGTVTAIKLLIMKC